MPSTRPLIEIPGHLAWSLERDFFYEDPAAPERPTSRSIRFSPIFPESRPGLRETSIVWDPLLLCESIRRPGGYNMLTCSCAYPPHAGIEAPVFVSHPDKQTVILEMDVQGLRPALDPKWHDRAGFLRMVFPRADYERSIRKMVQAARAADDRSLPIEEIEPNRDGLSWEHLLALDMDTSLGRRCPLFPESTRLEFGFAGSDIYFVDGRPGREWPSRFLTRWESHAAFKRWLAYARRGHGIRGFETGVVRQNDFFLLDESLRGACDAAGEAFVARLRADLAEESTAPGVIVEYRPCRLDAASPQP